MGTKHTSQCLQNAGDNEPIFVLLAQDELAPEVIRYWAQQAILSGIPDSEIVAALEQADLMEQWPNRKLPD